MSEVHSFKKALFFAADIFMFQLAADVGFFEGRRQLHIEKTNPGQISNFISAKNAIGRFILCCFGVWPKHNS